MRNYDGFKQFLNFYFSGLIVILIVSLLFSSNVIYVITHPGFWTLPAIFCFLGFLIGILIYELNLRPAEKKKKIFFISYSLGIVTLVIVIIFQGFNNVKRIKHKENFGNVESNHEVIKNWVYDNEEYIRIAFYRLEKEFKNPNDFDLDAFSVRKKDTIVNGYIDTTYNIYFVYFLKADTTNKYFSKVSVFTGKPELKIFNIDTKKNEEYMTIKAEKEEQENEAVREINKIVKQLKDSLKNKNQ